MVWYNAKERGGRLGWTTTLGLFISCTKCNHGARVRLDTALRLWGERGYARDITRDLRCSRCRACAACTHVIADSRPPWSIAADPGGGFALGPNWPIVDAPLAPATISIIERGWGWLKGE